MLGWRIFGRVQTFQLPLLKQLAANGPIYHGYKTHPWKGTLLTTCSLQQQAQIERALDGFLEALNNAIGLESRLTSLVQSVVKLLESTLLEKYTPALMGLELEDLLKRFTGPYRGMGKYLRYLGYVMSLRRIRRCCCAPPVTSDDSIIGDLNLALLVRNGRRCLQTKTGDLTTTDKLTNATHFGMFAALVSWVEDFLSATHELETCSIPVSLDPSILKDLRETVQSGTRIVPVLKSGFDFLRTLFPLEQTEATEQNTLNEVRCWVQIRHDGLTELRAWLDVENAIKQLRNLGLAEFVDESQKRSIKAVELPIAFEKRFYRLWLDETYRGDPVLNSFSSTLHEQAIDEFRKLDKRLVQETPRRIINELRSRRPDTGFTGPRSSGLGILQREIQKRRRHKPLRGLFSEIPALVQSLKPCFLMSPLSVASYLAPGQMKFDILLFDEASQIMPEDAIGSILRSPQTIVVGDTKQLPPTRFFATLEGEELQDEESSEDEILDSIMEETLASGLREKLLLWHYRSRDESLIAFSNYYFYNNTLITFPSAGIHNRPMGIEFLLVSNGVYDRSRSRTNRKEAEYVAGLVYQHYKQSPDRSLGVVAFSLSQADAIDAAIESLRQGDSDFDEWCNADSQERFFIKNLENVQGDERDVMFFSVGYGPDEKGQITMNFGPLNREEGRRRLNVAITRAREHVKLISSFDPSQLDLSRIHAEGVRLLKEYMEVAKHGLDAIPRAIKVEVSESESPFEEEVYEALRDKGLEIRKQIGVSGYRIDLGVVDPSRPGSFMLGIECDGSTYHSFKTARDRDRLRQQVLEGLGWKIHRIWSRDWVENRRIEIDKTLKAVREAQSRSETRGKETDCEPTESGSVNTQGSPTVNLKSSIDTEKPSVVLGPEPEQKALPQDVSVYMRTPLTSLHPSYMFESDTNTVADVLKRVVQQEGPIYKTEAARRVAANWQITRVGYRVQARIESIAQSNCPSVVVRGDFFWPKNMKESPVRVPAPGDEARSIEIIALEEIEQAAVVVIKRNFGMTRDDLVHETARLLGHARTGDTVRSRIESGINRLIRRGIVHQNGERLNTE
jgi:very-short-patch-repair endonuclease